jgi:DNA polymerase I
MSAVAIDIETDALDATRIWCICTEDEHGRKDTFTYVDRVPEEKARFLELMGTYDTKVFHGGIGFDVGVINRLLGAEYIKQSEVVDTLVLSRLDRYDRKDGHSLESLGTVVGYPKDMFDDFSCLSVELLNRCRIDTAITMLWYKKLRHLVDTPAAQIEHYIAWVCQQMHLDGFYFDRAKATDLLAEVSLKVQQLELEMNRVFEPVLTEVSRLKYRLTKEGIPYATVAAAQKKYYKTEQQGDELVCYDWVSFKPGSPKDRIERLSDAGWRPYEKTKGHIEYLRSKEHDKAKEQRYKVYGWTCSEGNLSTLPVDAPAGARTLAQWLTLEGRRKSLVEWLGQVHQADSRIHGSFFHIGAWTQRLSHSNPNEANIPSTFHSSSPVLSPVDEIKQQYNGRMRELWTVPKGHYLVGTDADGIQLRVLSCLMKSDAYVQAIVSGDKAKETDIHNMNRKALGLEHLTRDDAKTFIYAFLLGAGIPKVAHILRTSTAQAELAVANFLENIPGLKKLKTITIPAVASRGYFLGFDGRKVLVPSQHKALAGMLQAGEAVVMKHATRIWMQQAKAERWYQHTKLCTWPHDEWQTEVQGDETFARYVGQAQCNAIEQAGVALKLFCPLAGEYKIGNNWKDTH